MESCAPSPTWPPSSSRWPRRRARGGPRAEAPRRGRGRGHRVQGHRGVPAAPPRPLLHDGGRREGARGARVALDGRVRRRARLGLDGDGPPLGVRARRAASPRPTRRHQDPEERRAIQKIASKTVAATKACRAPKSTRTCVRGCAPSRARRAGSESRPRSAPGRVDEQVDRARARAAHAVLEARGRPRPRAAARRAPRASTRTAASDRHVEGEHVGREQPVPSGPRRDVGRSARFSSTTRIRRPRPRASPTRSTRSGTVAACSSVNRVFRRQRSGRKSTGVLRAS